MAVTVPAHPLQAPDSHPTSHPRPPVLARNVPLPGAKPSPACGRGFLVAGAGERENFHRSAPPCPPPADTPDASLLVTTSQVTASLHDFAVSLRRASPARRAHRAGIARTLGRTSPAHACAGTVRGRDDPVPPAARGDGVGRAASVFPTSPPQQAKRARSGTLRLCSESEKAAGGRWYRSLGNPGTPRPRKITARFRGSPRPPPDLPKTTTDPAAPMTVESARRDGPGRAHGHGTSTHPGTAPRLPYTEACKQPGEPGTRQSPVPRSPGPPPALPQPEGAQARHDRLAYRADPGHHGNHYRARRHPGTALTRPARKQPTQDAARSGVPPRTGPPPDITNTPRCPAS